MTGGELQPADPAAVAGAGRPHLVGLGHARDGALGRRPGHEPAELDAAVRGHRRVRSASCRPSRSTSFATPGSPPAGSASRASRSAAACCRSSPTRTASTSAGATPTAATSSVRLEGTIARFGRSYAGEPDVIAEELAKDPAVQMADTVLLTVPNQLGRRVLRDGCSRRSRVRSRRRSDGRLRQKPCKTPLQTVKCPLN